MIAAPTSAETMQWLIFLAMFFAALVWISVGAFLIVMVGHKLRAWWQAYISRQDRLDGVQRARLQNVARFPERKVRM